MLVISNKFNVDIDLEILEVTRRNSSSSRGISFLIIILGLIFEVFVTLAFITNLSIILDEPNEFVYFLFIKLNYIDVQKNFKKTNEKKLLRYILIDIYDRFIMFLCLFYIAHKKISEGKISEENYLTYLIKYVYLIITEIVFDWIKDAIIFKITLHKAEFVRLAIFDIAILHERFRTMDEYMDNQDIHKQDAIFQRIHNYKLKILTLDDTSILDRYSKYVDYENLMCMTIDLSIIIFCVFIIDFILIISYYLTAFQALLLVCLCYLIQKFLKLKIQEYVVDRIERYN